MDGNKQLQLWELNLSGAYGLIDIARLRKPLQVAAGVTAAISLGEFGATTFLTRTGTETMPIAIAKLVK